MNGAEKFDEPLLLQINGLYEGVDYSTIAINDQFWVMEGSIIVATGTILDETLFFYIMSFELSAKISSIMKPFLHFILSRSCISWIFFIDKWDISIVSFFKMIGEVVKKSCMNGAIKIAKYPFLRRSLLLGFYYLFILLRFVF